MAKASAGAAPEPSMEEILASIRRIIAEDEPPIATASSSPVSALPQAASPGRSTPETPMPVSAAEVDALFGARAEAVAEAAASSQRVLADAPLRSSIRPESIQATPVADPRELQQTRVDRQNAAPFYAPEPAIVAPVAVETTRIGNSLLSPSSDAAVQNAFGALAGNMLAGSQLTLDDLVKDMLRPMLKAWLDTNLPPLVEKLVRDEIERVSRGR